MTAGIEFDPAERDAIAAEVNISVLKRSDTAIKCVLKSANHVCLYRLGDDHQWRRLDVEGSLFVVERHLNHQNNPNHHMHRIVIINRKSLNNYTDDIIVGNKHLELSDQMIMYSNSKKAIIGIWFYEKAQAHQIFDLLQRITNDDSPQSTADQSRQKRTPKRPAKPADPAPSNSTPKPDTAGQSRSDNSLERFFPNLKLTNGVAGHQVPQNAKGSMFESQAVSTMSTSPKNQQTATAFKPTADIDEAIITASEVGIPEGAAGSSITDVKVLASQARQVVRGNPRPDPKRKITSRPRPNPKPIPAYNSNHRSNSRSPVKINSSETTISPPRSKPVPQQQPSVRPNAQPAPRQPPSARPNALPAPRQPPSVRPNAQPAPRQSPSARPNSSTRTSTRGTPYPPNNPSVKQPKQPPKPSPPAKRASAGKGGYNVRGSGANRQHLAERPTTTSIRTQVVSKSGGEGDDVAPRGKRVPQIQLLTKPKRAVDPKPVASGENSGRGLPSTERVPVPPKLAGAEAGNSTRNGRKINDGDVKAGAPASSSDAQEPSTPNVPIPVEVPGAPRAKQVEKYVDDGAREAGTSSPGGNETVQLENDEASRVKMGTVLSEEEVMRQMRNMSMRQAQGNMKVPEAHMVGMAGAFPFISGDLGLGQVGGMMGGGLAGGGGGAAGFGPTLHPQMALMMQQQQQHLFMQQQLIAQHHQRQMQLQAEHAAQAMGNGMGEMTGSADRGGGAKTKEESANDLMRMLKVERGNVEKRVQRSDARSEEARNGEGLGASIAEAERLGELGSNGEKLDKDSFRAVVQRMLTDRKLFDGVYGHYLRYGAQ